MTAAAELIVPAARWSPQFDQHEFLLQEPGPLDQSESALTQLAQAIDGLRTVVQNVRLPAWSGVAADSYRAYLACLSNVIGNMSLALINAAGAVGLTGDNIEGYQRPLAVDAARICNDAQIVHAQLEQHRIAACLPITDIFFAAPESEMSEGLARGARCQQGVQQTLADLAFSLLSIEGSYSYLTLPSPPTTTDPVLVDIFSPIQAAGVTTGQTPSAEAAFAYLTGRELALTSDLRTTLESLTPAEREWVLDHLPSWLLTAIMLDNDLSQLQGDYEWFAQNLPLEELDLIAGADPYGYFRPLSRFPDGPPNVFWAPTIGGAKPLREVGDLRQGTIGDCHLLASLAAIAISPRGDKFFDKSIRYNENGTYSVTLYTPLGVPFQITVLPEVVTSEDAAGTDVVAYAQPGAGALTAFQIYEKAVAQASAAGMIDLNSNPGGYADLHFGNSVVDLPILTGQEATLYPASEVTAQQIQVALAAGLPVTVGTQAANLKPGSAYTYKQAPAGQHAYYVIEINMGTDGKPPEVTLGNPWGPGQEIVLTITELQNETSSVTIGEFR